MDVADENPGYDRDATGAGVAVVTGGASGIGFALAAALGARGQHVLIADRDEQALAAAATQLRDLGLRVQTHAVDVRDRSSLAELSDSARALGRIDTVCMNAGVTSTGSTLWDTTDETFDFVMSVNLGGLQNSIRALVPPLVDQGTPADIVITASMAGIVASGYSGAYGASKAGAVALAKALRAEVAVAAPFIHVALLNPGMVRTNLIRTSATSAPESAALSEELVEGGHRVLNEAGVAPAAVAADVLDALAHKRFWVLPHEGDPFVTMLDSEMTELSEALAADRDR